MSTIPIQVGGQAVDLSQRFVWSKTVAASPTGASETIIASVTIPDNVTVVSAVVVTGWAALTIGTSGVSYKLIIKQTDTSGTAIADSGALTATATNLVSGIAYGFDDAPVGGQKYVLTLTVASGAAASTVSAVGLSALVV